MKTGNYMAIDQYGNTFHGLTHPRADLIQKIGVSHVQKMFIDKKDGSTVHVGYIVGRHWCTVYKVERMEVPA